MRDVSVAGKLWNSVALGPWRVDGAREARDIASKLGNVTLGPRNQLLVAGELRELALGPWRVGVVRELRRVAGELRNVACGQVRTLACADLPAGRARREVEAGLTLGKA